MAPFEPSPDVVDRVLEVLRRTLGRGDLGADQSFFEAGGDSFGALQVVSELQAEWPTLTSSTLFGSPSATALAAHLELERALDYVESLSEEEAARLLAEESDG